MQEATKTLAKILKTDWSLKASRIKKSKITFRRGEPFDLTTRFNKNKISIEVTKMTIPITKRVLARELFRELLNVSVWMVIKPRNERTIATMKDNRQLIEDEVNSIIHTNQRTLTDIRFCKLANTRYIDRYEEEPPTLRAVIMVSAQYEK